MLTIKKVRANETIDHAAQELRKYLRMMMPECGDVKIAYAPEAKTGFRLGLLEDFGLPTDEAEDPTLDDVIHVDCTEDGGILAGSNPRSVLFSVYRFLRENGCRWLYPGVDGDYVPMKDIEAVQYHKKADHRFRGFCNEGTESQQAMLDCADYYAKLEMNVYMLEWFTPVSYYTRYYEHTFNRNRIPEPVPRSQILQWKRQCECEIAKRGFMFHDIGHGWASRAFNFDEDFRKRVTVEELGAPQEVVDMMAMINGKRDFHRGKPGLTNYCMSNPKFRTIFAKTVADYAENHSNSDFLHVWLADHNHNHCECEECQKMRPSDYYMMIMNELDEELTARNLDTRIVFIAYVDTLWGPEYVEIKNPKRFSLLYAPVTRSYTSSINENTPVVEPPAYLRNKWESPKAAELSMALLRSWRKLWKGPAFCYEYHFWRHQFNDPGGLTFAKRIWEDIRGIKYMGIDGFVEDGSQRSGFPNAFPVYIYAETLMNRECDFDAVKADYFSHIYGEDWQEAENLLSRFSAVFDFGYMEGEKSVDPTISIYYNPQQAQKLLAVADLSAEERILVAKHMVMPTRPQTVSWRMLGLHAKYCEKLAQILMEKALGNNFKALQLAQEFYDELGVREMEFEPYYDHCLACRVVEHKVGKSENIIID